MLNDTFLVCLEIDRTTMANHFKWFDGAGEIIPWPARYSYPSQATAASKQIVKIPPTNGQTFTNTSNPIIQINFPAQGYLDTTNSYLVFDVAINVPTAASNLKFQNGIQSIFSRLTLLYGSTVIEDIQDYNVMVRMLNEATAIKGGPDQLAITEGIGTLKDFSDTAGDTFAFYKANVRGHEIQANNFAVVADTFDIAEPGTSGGTTAFSTTKVSEAKPQAIQGSGNTRRYMVQLALGLFQQKKLIPLKWMASQLQVRIELAPNANCMSATKWTGDESYTISNMAYLCQLMEFDSSYDAAFLAGLKGEGVPIKFASWNRYLNSTGGASSTTLTFQERNRSIKAAYTMQLVQPALGTLSTGGEAVDAHAMLQSSTGYTNGVTTAGSMLNNYQVFILVFSILVIFLFLLTKYITVACRR